MLRPTVFFAFAVSQLAPAAAFSGAPLTVSSLHGLWSSSPSHRGSSTSSSLVPLRPSRTTGRQERPRAVPQAKSSRCLQQIHYRSCDSNARVLFPSITKVEGVVSEAETSSDRSKKIAGVGTRRVSSGRPLSTKTARLATLAASALAVGVAAAMFAPAPAAAAAKIAAGGGGEHLHVGQKIANFFRRGGLPDWATLMVISAMPVVELRGGVPVGIWMGMPIVKVFTLCVAGNMIPIPLILLALRSSFVQKLAKPVLDRAREKAAGFGDEKSQALALTLFVGIPLPGTGAWTGAMGAFLLGMPFQKAMLSIFLGVVSAGGIMSCLTLAGKPGALLATAILAVFCVTSIMGGGGDKKNKASDFASK